jgi:hypothetical protein
VDLSVDINNILLVSTVLRRPISKISVLFGIGLLSEPTPILRFLVLSHISSSYKVLSAHLEGGMEVCVEEQIITR